jgi:hypothetical protein
MMVADDSVVSIVVDVASWLALAGWVVYGALRVGRWVRAAVADMAWFVSWICHPLANVKRCWKSRSAA